MLKLLLVLPSHATCKACLYYVPPVEESAAWYCIKGKVTLGTDDKPTPLDCPCYDRHRDGSIDLVVPEKGSEIKGPKWVRRKGGQTLISRFNNKRRPKTKTENDGPVRAFRNPFPETDL